MTSDAAYLRLGMRIFVDMSGTIAVPCVLAAILGEWLDERYNSAPWILMGMLLLAFFGSSAIVARKALKYGKEYQHLLDSDQS